MPCIYPLSPTHSILPRLNTLTLLIFTLHGPSSNWATRAALAASLTRTAVIALQAFALLAIARHPGSIPAKDLDIFAAWEVLGASACALPLLLGWAPVLRGSRARPLVRVWGLLILAGACCAYAAQEWRVEDRAGERCADARLGMKGNHGAVAAEIRPSRPRLVHAFDIAALVMAAFGAWACVRPRVETAVGSEEAEVGMRMRVLRGLERAAVVVSVVVFWGFVGVHERWLEGLPEEVSRGSFDQWGPWAATGVVLLATLVDYCLMVGKEKEVEEIV
ncbi:hypothetical protein EJ06DRAFT_530918 [Trichodelitschia bisporula]|uniref:Uncharacterized protein n=1 Tax=Trichodelitschia bisporula TaxID=703511 RepID=A0A6G1HU48_9PEZI|nr:hypothetical protein EJ06DRAFT_530918 [Trichodelitschia bisporula]